MSNKTAVNYLSRDYKSLRTDLINWAKAFHPDTLNYFNDANPDVMYLEMCAYVGDMLSYYTDKTFNEAFRTTAQSRTSLVRIANDLGFFELGSTPASTQVVFSIRVPYVTVDGVNYPDPNYLIALKPEVKLKATNGQFYEVLEDVNFADKRNRIEIMNLDSNNQLVDYTIEKYLPAKAGQTKVQRFYVSETLSKPFLNVTINDNEVTEVVGVITEPGNVFVIPEVSEFSDPDKRFYEVRDLVQKTLFLEVNPTDTINQTIKTGEQVEVPKRFIARRDENDLVTVTFGNNAISYDTFEELIQTTAVGDLNLSTVLTNTSLGEIPAPNTTLFIKYRVGGGSKTNAQVGQINNIAYKQFYPPSSSVNFTKLQAVRATLAVVNNIAAVGGKEVPTVEEIRATAGRVFATQDRGVTYPDIRTLIDTMPAKYGRAFRVSSEEIKPKIGNYTELVSYVNGKLSELLDQDTQMERIQKVTEIKDYFNSYEEKAQLTTETLGTAPTLWLGEKMRIYLISRDTDGVLQTLTKQNGIWVSPQDDLKTNISQFLINKRVQGDWVDIVDGRVVNLQCEFTVLADRNRKQEILVQCLQTLKDYFNVENWEMNQPIFISNVITTLQQLNGLINVVDIKFYNIFGKDPFSGKEYQPIEIGRYRNNYNTPIGGNQNKYEMVATGNIIKGYPDTLFECRWPESDIIGNVI